MKAFAYYLSIILMAVLVLPLAAGAFPIAVGGTEGLPVVVSSTDNVIATYQGNSAAYSNDLYLDNHSSGTFFIFNNHGSLVGSTVDLGSFAIGTELLFRLHVNNTGYDFFTGPASRNPDNHMHARVEQDWQPDEALVSFEDLYNGAFNYNDLSFSFTNVVSDPEIITPGIPNVPEPATVILLGSGLAGLFFSRRKTIK